MEELLVESVVEVVVVVLGLLQQTNERAIPITKKAFFIHV